VPVTFPSRDHYTACLLGGAIGDALGAPVEFLSRAEILQRFGPQGITDHAEAYGGRGRITDDTQMTLFTAEGLLRGRLQQLQQGRADYGQAVADACLRWLVTQGGEYQEMEARTDGWLFRQKSLHSRRSPGMTCLTALQDYPGETGIAGNDSKGCGGVMRVAPVGLFRWALQEAGADQAFADGCMCAGLTHGHPTGYLSGGVFAAVIFNLLDGQPLPDAMASARQRLLAEPGHEETAAALDLALTLSTSGMPHADAIAALGEGWVAEEALAIALYCALVAESFEQGILLAVNHDGDSDSTGAMAGQLLGLMSGTAAIPSCWLEPLELRPVIETVAADLWECGRWQADTIDLVVRQRYPVG
jgi:ADP-ribosylglycohydrolase